MKNDYEIATEIVERRGRLLGRELTNVEKIQTRVRVLYLLKNAKPCNWAWRTLEDSYALDGDISEYDYE